jgi:hypothetical protein
MIQHGADAEDHQVFAGLENGRSHGVQGLLCRCFNYQVTVSNHPCEIDHLGDVAQRMGKCLCLCHIAAVHRGQVGGNLSPVQGFGQRLPNRAQANNPNPHHPALHNMNAQLNISLWIDQDIDHPRLA